MGTEQKLVGIMQGQFEDKLDINLESELTALGYDSLKFIHLVIKIEHEFGIEFEDENLLARKFTTVGQIVDYIDGRG